MMQASFDGAKTLNRRRDSESIRGHLIDVRDEPTTSNFL